MSLNGEVNRIAGDVRDAIERISRKGVSATDGAVRGTRKIFGYVCAVHEDGELAGTVDVQEYNYEPDEYTNKGTGLHKGVLLSAIQDNKEGLLVVPMVFSDVVITADPVDGREYVVMYSFASRIRLKVRSIEGKDDGSIEIGVTEHKDFRETDDGLEKDYDELEATNNGTSAIYTSKSITETVSSPDDENGYFEEKTAGGKVIRVGDTTITIDGGSVTVQTTSAKVEAENCEINGKEVTITGGNLNTMGTSNTDLNGPFNAIKVCPFSGAPHCGSIVSGT